MKKMQTRDDITRNMLNRIRLIKEETEKKEEDKKQSAIAITDDPRFGQNALTSQIEQFKSSVESGAQFSKPGDNVADSPLIYLPDTGNLIFSGTIPCLNNLKWQFVLKTSTGSGCFIWSDGMILNKDNMQILNKLYGFYENWKNQWESESRDLEMINNTIKNEDF
jgi:hypothetical protein